MTRSTRPRQEAFWGFESVPATLFADAQTATVRSHFVGGGAYVQAPTSKLEARIVSHIACRRSIAALEAGGPPGQGCLARVERRSVGHPSVAFRAGGVAGGLHSRGGACVPLPMASSAACRRGEFVRNLGPR